MAHDDAGERSEQPTPRRRQEALEQGRIARSHDLTAAVGLLAGLVLLNWLGPAILDQLLLLTRDIGRDVDVSTASVLVWLRRTAHAVGLVLLPFLALLVALAIAGGAAQTGLHLTWTKLQPKLEHISPAQGLRRIFSKDSVARLAQGLLKMGCVAAIGYYTIAGDWALLCAAGELPVVGILHLSTTLVFKLALRMALVLLILGIADYLFQRWQLEQSLKMTKQEVKEELKRMEGDPLIKQRQREIQRKIAMQRLALDVPKADVVVTNPTHYSVALRYDQASMNAPKLVAKGKDFLALHIRQLARQHGVPIVERPPLARALYAAVDVGQEVPPAYYRAVAEVLAFVYRLSRRAG